MSKLALPLLLLLGAISAASCGDAAGTSCTSAGSGFSLKSSCATQCLDLWTVICPGGERISPQVCSGKEGCTPGSCPDAQVCYQFDDPFEIQAYCIPASVCPGVADAAARSAWEAQSRKRAEETRASPPGH